MDDEWRRTLTEPNLDAESEVVICCLSSDEGTIREGSRLGHSFRHMGLRSYEIPTSSLKAGKPGAVRANRPAALILISSSIELIHEFDQAITTDSPTISLLLGSDRHQLDNLPKHSQLILDRDRYADRLVEICLSLGIGSPHLAANKRVIESKTASFVGRSHLFNELNGWIAQDGQKSGYFLLTGAPGQGKTTAIAEFMRRHGHLGHFNDALTGIVTTEHFRRALSDQNEMLYSPPSSSRSQDGPQLPTVTELLHLLAEGGSRSNPIVLAVDALDEVRKTDEPEAANTLLLPASLPDHVYIVASSRRTSLQLTTASSRSEYDLGAYQAESLDDIRSYVELRLTSQNLRENIEKSGLDPDELSGQLVRQSEANFMFVQHLLDEIELQPTPELLDQLPRGLVGYYDYHWARMRIGSLAEPGLTLNVLHLLATIRSPITAEVLADISDTNLDTTTALLAQWQQFLEIDRRQDLPTYRLYHKSFQDYLSTRDEIRNIGSSLLLQKLTDRLSHSLRLSEEQ